MVTVMHKNILFEIEGAIAKLTINRPDKRNAVDNATVEEIDQALAQVEKNPGIRVLILTGAGEKAFVAGADIHELDKRDTLRGRSETRRRQEVTRGLNSWRSRPSQPSTVGPWVPV